MAMVILSATNSNSQTNNYLFERKAKESGTAFVERYFED